MEIRRLVTDWELLSCKNYNLDVYVKSIIKEYEDSTPLINTIEIEAVNRCSNECSFCPVSKGNDIREMKKCLMNFLTAL